MEEQLCKALKGAKTAYDNAKPMRELAFQPFKPLSNFFTGMGALQYRPRSGRRYGRRYGT